MISNDLLYIKAISNLLITEQFFGLVESKKDVNKTDSYYKHLYRYVCKSLLFELKFFGAEFIVINCNNTLVHQFDNDESTLWNSLLTNTIEEIYNKQPNEGYIINENETTNQILLKRKLSFRIQTESIGIDIWTFTLEYDKDTYTYIRSVVKRVIEKFLSIVKNYKNNWSDFNINYDINVPNWLFSYERDRLLFLAISIYQSYYNIEFNELLSSCYVLRYYPKINKDKSLVGYETEDYQIEAILNTISDEIKKEYYNRFSKILDKEKLKEIVDTHFDGSSYYSGSSIISGKTLYIKNWEQDEGIKDENYPQELEFIESKVIFNEEKYERVLIPINEFGENRFLVAIRIPKKEIKDESIKELIYTLENIFFYKSHELKIIIKNFIRKSIEDDYFNGKKSINGNKRADEYDLLVRDPKSDFNNKSQLNDLEDCLLAIKENINKIEKIESYAKIKAFAEVNSRTTSHNTGSHILAKKLLDIEDELNQLIEEVVKDKNSTEVGRLKEQIKTKQNEINQFHDYMRQRMLYNSDIVTGIPSFDMVYTIGDIIKRFGELSIVKKYISGLDKKTFGNLIPKKVIIEDKETDTLSDVKIAIPNGILGLHALFIIYENFIRNYFKHGGAKAQLDIKMKLIPEKETTDHYCLCIYPDGGTAINEESFKIIETYLNDPILAGNNKLRYGGLGLLEMKGAACYLNNVSVADIDEYTIQSSTKKVKVLQAQKMKDGRLGYFLYLKKPKKVLIVSKSLINSEEFNKRGINITDNVDLKKNYTHEFIIVHNEYLIDDIVQHGSSVPTRILLYNNSNEIKACKYSYSQLAEIEFDSVLKNENDYLFVLHKKWKEYVLKEKGINQPIQICEIENDELSNIYDDEPLNEYALKLVTEHYKTGIAERSEYLFYEAYRNAELSGSFYGQFDTYSQDIVNEFICTAVTKVGILEERVQAAIVKMHKQQAVRNDFDKANIFIPAVEEIDLNTEDIKSHKDYNLLKLQNWLENISDKLDYLVIHLGFIERFINEKNEDEIEKFIINHIEKYIDTNITKIVLTTERGSTGSIPEKYYYLHYSNFSQYLLSERSKYHFVKMLYSCRKKTIN